MKQKKGLSLRLCQLLEPRDQRPFLTKRRCSGSYDSRVRIGFLALLSSADIGGSNPCEVGALYQCQLQALSIRFSFKKEHAAVTQYALSRAFPVPVSALLLPQFHHLTGGDGAKSELSRCRSWTSMYTLCCLCVYRPYKAILAKSQLATVGLHGH
jgi:hypothetical protein